MKDLEHYQMERDIYKNKVCQLVSGELGFNYL